MKRFCTAAVCFFIVLSLWAKSLPVSGSFDWMRAKSIASGIRLKDFTYNKPRPLKVYAVRIDLAHPDIYLVTNQRDKDWGQAMPDYPQMKIQTRRTRVYDFMQSYQRSGQDMRLAVNASPWRPWTKPFTHKYAGSIGLMVSNGTVVALPQKRTVPALVVRKNGKVELIKFKEGDKTSDIQLALSGFEIVLQDGKQVCNNKIVLHPRTFYGLSRDGSKLYLVIADGRQKDYSEGMALCEGARFLKYLGADDGINMDGGGSTTLVTGSNGKAEVVNTPPGAGQADKKDKYKYTRKVANSLGVCLRKKQK